MSFESLIHIKKALSTINPKQVRDLSERRLRVGLFATNPDAFDRMEAFFLQDLSPSRRRDSATQLVRAPIAPHMQPLDLAVYEEDAIPPSGAILFNPGHRQAFATAVLRSKPELGVPLARSFGAFRKPYIDRVIAKVSRENAFFSVTTALPDVIPNVIELPWAIAEFASDTAFLTMNQVRMAFLLAAASDREVGYLEQKAEIATVIGSAFGWRALARQLVGKVPFGGGLIAKAAVAYAGTKVLGLSLERFYSIGFTYTREERDRLYFDAFRQGKNVATKMLMSIRPELAARFQREAELSAPRSPAPAEG